MRHNLQHRISLSCIMTIFIMLLTSNFSFAGFVIKQTTAPSTPVQTDTITKPHRSILGRIQHLKEKRMAAVADDATHPARPKRSGIFGRLSLYLGLLSMISFILLLSTLLADTAAIYATIWLISSFLAIIAGFIGIHHRKKKGMAVAGLLIGIGEVALMFALASFISAVAVNLPGIMAVIFVIGHGG